MESVRTLLFALLLATLTLSGCGSDGGTGPGDEGNPVPEPERIEFRQVSRDPLSNDLIELTVRDGVGLAISRDGMVALRKAPGEDWFTPERFTDNLERFVACHITASGTLLASASDRVFRAKAAGADWSEVLDRELGGFFSIVSDAKTVIMVGRAIFRSTDDGATWTELDVEHSGVFDQAASLGSGIFLTLTTQGTLFRSEDDGSTWQVLDANPPVDFFASRMQFIDDLDGIVVKANSPSTTLVTETGGKSWEEVPGVGQIRDLATLPSGFVVALRSNAKLHVSNDGGRTFSAEFESDRDLLAQPEAVHAITESNWLLVGDDGVIIETVNGGGSWQERTRGLTVDICELAVSTDGVVVAGIGDCEFGFFRTNLAISTDAGLTFTIFGPLAGSFDAVKLGFRGNFGIALARDGLISTSTDGGRSWAPSRQVTDAILTDVAFVDDRTLVATGPSGTVVRSTDGGTSFEQVFDTGGANQRILNFPGTSNLVVTGSVAMRSTNLGDTWSVIDLQGLERPRELAATTANTAFGISGQSSLVRTDDAGASWRMVFTLADVELVRIVFATPLHGLLLSSEGILQTLDGGETWEAQEVGTGPKLLTLTMDAVGGAWIGGINGQLFRGVAP